MHIHSKFGGHFHKFKDSLKSIQDGRLRKPIKGFVDIIRIMECLFEVLNVTSAFKSLERESHEKMSGNKIAECYIQQGVGLGELNVQMDKTEDRIKKQNCNQYPESGQFVGCNSQSKFISSFYWSFRLFNELDFFLPCIKKGSYRTLQNSMHRLKITLSHKIVSFQYLKCPVSYIDIVKVCI